ncbi:hypothetical protein [Rheinheimera sp.]|uniref:hypothetical protein n=1 Tax=Rheinheimera sp. TaxID=1869214 RepID=UPI00307D2AED
MLRQTIINTGNQLLDLLQRLPVDAEQQQKIKEAIESVDHGVVLALSATTKATPG